ncbi:autoinducer binding domain-containing protein [Photorhabdus sp. SF281]|uniref:autoinducer binding domain-containing protein n=1 Tax=Photorhabdus sp. SF281 TaxID=3459527 RepID=UPI004044B0D3
MNKNSKKITEEFSQNIKCIVESFGVQSYSYVIKSKYNQNEPLIISNFPIHWLNKYKKLSLHRIDPILIAARKNIIPFSWQDKNSNKFDNLRYLELNSCLVPNSLFGYTFPLHDHKNNFAALTVCNIESNSEFEYLIENNKNTIQAKLASIHHEILLFDDGCDKVINNNVRLTKREKQILYWASQGKTYPEISIILAIK